MTKDDYDDYGPEWEKDMLRCTKAELVRTIRLQGIHCDRLADLVCRLEKTLHDAGLDRLIKEAQRGQS